MPKDLDRQSSRAEVHANGQDRRNVRPTAVVALVALTIGLFVGTEFLTRSYQAEQDHLAREWYQRGDAALSSKQAALAVEDFRNALSYSRDDPQYRLRLAQALLAANRTDEALSHLRSLWQDEPGNGETNLQLARIAARRQDRQDALRYFHTAIYGAWEQDAETHRREARFELVKFLLTQNQTIQAQAELTALAAGLPSGSVPLRSKVADLFAATGDFANALNQYQQVLRLDRKDQQALAGAGRAAFELGRYGQAQHYLEAVVHADAQDSHSAQLLQLADLVFRLDPLQREISQVERRRRGIAAFEQAGERLQSCAQQKGQPLPAAVQEPAIQPGLANLYDRWVELRPKMNERALRRYPDSLQAAVDLAFRVEEQTATLCGQPTGADLALLLISRQKQGTAQ